MEYLALYRKYRPREIADVVGQRQIVQILKKEVELDKISHAYLFSGPRGTGKTTIAKIFANLVNCKNSNDGKTCGKCEWCLNENNIDVVEIDAASNNGIDEIREIIEKVSLMPSLGKYKVYIIDEVHMLTIQAFNALLKTLEEPPHHIIFILATTDVHKVPLTISSRCQKFCFNTINKEDMIKRLTYISKQEKINISSAGLAEIASLSEGGLRDAINLLDQLSVYGFEEISDREVDLITDSITYEDIYDIINCLSKSDKINLINILEKLDKNNSNIKMLFFRICEIFKDILLKKNNIKINSSNYADSRIKIINDFSNSFSEKQIIKIIKDLNEKSLLSKNDSFSKILLVTTFFNFISESLTNDEQKENKLVTVDLEKEDKRTKEENNKKNIYHVKSENTNEIIRIKNIRINNTFVSASKDKLKEFNKKWNFTNEIINEFSEEDILILKDSLPVLVGSDHVIILSNFESVSKKINNCLEKVEKIIEKIYNKKYKVISLTNLEWEEEKKKYIKNLEKNYKYSYIYESNETSKESDNIIENSNSLDNLKKIVGEEIIEYELEG